ncbi:MAG: chemotaxis response regulator protein-glutamate methylesterase [Rhodospirillaceae bacterium]
MTPSDPAAVPATRRRIRVLIVDDSAVVRQLLTDICSSDPELEVVGTAVDPLIARDKIKALSPDVLTLDVEMPRMNGIEFLEKLMRLRPMPVVMISSLTRGGDDLTLRALELGAIDYVAKPLKDLQETLPALRTEIIEKIKVAAGARVRAKVAHRTPAPILHDTATTCNFDIIAIGASTGGVESITALLQAFPQKIPATVIVQHMPEAFMPRFIARLGEVMPFPVEEARDGLMLSPGRVLIAPGNRHLRIVSKGNAMIVHLGDDPAESGHRPSVDVLFTSLASVAARIVGVLLTGMGRDGAEGLLRLKEAGALTIAQDADTSTVYGMPRAAASLGAAQKILPLPKIAAAIFQSDHRSDVKPVE